MFFGARARGDSPVATKLKIKPRRRKRWNDYEYRRELIWSLLDQDQYFVLESPEGALAEPASWGDILFLLSWPRVDFVEESTWSRRSDRPGITLSLESLAEVPFSR